MSAGEAPNPAAVSARAARRGLARVVAGAALIALCATATLAWLETWSAGRALVLARGTGWVACGALLASLVISPLSLVWTRLRAGKAAWPNAGIVRRALGMTAAWLALLHAACALGGPLAGDLVAVGSWPYLRAGAAALGVLLLLLATSFGAVVARLRLRMFRELHRLSFVAALLVLQHLLLSPFAPRALVLALFAGTAALGSFRLLRLGRPEETARTAGINRRTRG